MSFAEVFSKQVEKDSSMDELSSQPLATLSFGSSRLGSACNLAEGGALDREQKNIMEKALAKRLRRNARKFHHHTQGQDGLAEEAQGIVQDAVDKAERLANATAQKIKEVVMG